MKPEPQIREEFEQWIIAPPYVRSITRYPADAPVWAGQYRRYETEIAWQSCLAATRRAEQ